MKYNQKKSWRTILKRKGNLYVIPVEGLRNIYDSLNEEMNEWMCSFNCIFMYMWFLMHTLVCLFLYLSVSISQGHIYTKEYEWLQVSKIEFDSLEFLLKINSYKSRWWWSFPTQRKLQFIWYLSTRLTHCYDPSCQAGCSTCVHGASCWPVSSGEGTQFEHLL